MAQRFEKATLLATENNQFCAFDNRYMRRFGMRFGGHRDAGKNVSVDQTFEYHTRFDGDEAASAP